MPDFRIAIVLWCALLVGCVAAPVQEMSDARQAINAASAVGANAHNSNAMSDAEALINQAEDALDSRRYREARRLAVEAKVKAISARTFVQQQTTAPLPAEAEQNLW